MGATGAAISCSVAQNERLIGGLYAQMGTSITAGLRAPDAYRAPAIVGERLQIDAVNVGFESTYTGIGIHDDFDQLSLLALSEAIVSADWSKQDIAVSRLSTLEDETKPPILRKLKGIDFSKVTYLGLEYGTNDFTLNVPIGKDSDTSGTTFKGALSQAVRKLTSTYPMMKIFFITPAWFLDEKDRDTDYNANKAGHFLKDYVDAMLEIADINRIHCLDMWRTLGVNKDTYNEFTFDSKHPNAKGAQRRGELTASFITKVYGI